MEEFLSAGTLNNILSTGNTHLNPIVQIMLIKEMSNAKLRAVLYDGKDTVQQCILFSAYFQQMYQENKFEKFTVVKLTKYTLSSIKKTESSNVILIHDLEVLKLGKEVNRKLEPGERFSRPAGSQQLYSSENSHVASVSRAAPSASPVRPLQVRQPQAPEIKMEVDTVSRDSTEGLLMGTPDGGSLRTQETCPINVVTPFFNNWVIKCKVTNKGQIRNWSNAKGEGSLFSFDVCDESGGLRFTAFQEDCKLLFPLIEKGQGLLISRGTVKPANKKYTPFEYEATVNQRTIIEAVPDLSKSIQEPTLSYHFVYLSDLNNMSENSRVDVIGVINNVGEMSEIISKKTNKTLNKRDITLVDQSNAECRVTMWDDDATNFMGQMGQVLAIKNASVNDFQGKNLNCGTISKVNIDPDLPEAHTLKLWFQKDGESAQFVKLHQQGTGSSNSAGNYAYLCQISSLKPSVGDPSRTFTFNSILASTNRTSNHFYKACKVCNKKLQDDNTGMLSCSKCHSTTSEYGLRMLISLNVTDATGSLWVTVFQEAAEQLFEKKVGDIGEVFQSNPQEYLQLVNSLRFKNFYFRVGVKPDDYNNEIRLRSSAYKISPLSSIDRSTRLMSMIDRLEVQLGA